VVGVGEDDDGAIEIVDTDPAKGKGDLVKTDVVEGRWAEGECGRPERGVVRPGAELDAEEAVEVVVEEAHGDGEGGRVLRHRQLEARGPRGAVAAVGRGCHAKPELPAGPAHRPARRPEPGSFRVAPLGARLRRFRRAARAPSGRSRHASVVARIGRAAKALANSPPRLPPSPFPRSASSDTVRDAMTVSAHSSAHARAPGLLTPNDFGLVALGPEHFPEALGLLAASPHQHAWLLAAMERQGPAAFHGRHGWVGITAPASLSGRSRLVGIISVGLHTHVAWTLEGRLPPGLASRLAEVLAPIPRRPPVTSAITGADGVVDAVGDALWRLGAFEPPPGGAYPRPGPGRPVRAIIPRAGGALLVDRGPQEIQVLRPRALPAGARCARLEPAGAGDLEALIAVDREMAEEELGAAAPASHAAVQRDATRGRIADRRVWLVRGVGGRILFKVDIGALTATWAHLAGVWTAPAARRQGIARAAVGELCHLLLRGGRDVGLSVYADNGPARALYDALGFVGRGHGRVLWIL
jgi:GNAT superfamily N-acetyltransferase